MSACHINILVHNRIRLLLFCKVKICTFGNFSPGREIFDQKEDGTKVSQIFKIVPDLNQFLGSWKNAHMDYVLVCVEKKY